MNKEHQHTNEPQSSEAAGRSPGNSLWDELEAADEQSSGKESSYEEFQYGWEVPRYLDPSRLKTLVFGCILTGLFYGAIVLVSRQFQYPIVEQLTNMFLRPSNQVVIIPASILFFWSTIILFFKRRSLKYQKKGLDFAIIPRDEQFVLNSTTAQDVITRLEKTTEQPDHFLLLRRIRISLSNLNNLGQVSDVSDFLKGEAEEDENRLDNSFFLIHSFVWAIPVLGFIGTAIGLSLAIGNFAGVLNKIGEIEELQASLGEVTSGLGTAFETTLIGLFFALLLQLLASIEEDDERRFLNECSIYCQEKIISRLKISNS